MDVMEWGISWTLATAHWTAGLDGAVLHARALPLLTFVLIVCGSIFALLWNGWERSGGIALILLGLIFIPFTRSPDILVSEDFKLIGLRDSDGHMSVSSGRADKFSAENWMRLNGEGKNKPPVWPREGVVETGNLTCGEEGCRAEINGHRAAFPRSPSVLNEDCRWAEIIVATMPLPKKCQAKVALDLFDGHASGAHAVWINETSIHTRSSFESRGRRPWTRYPGDAQ
jgi:competence protein ComEC